uniref:Leukocyte immunoglobulin-like receptor subfamily A member 5 n=1 Tax=Canis lupus dingo TaxID=286419 RepID=A0A8C0KUN4_CANLU
LTPGPAYFTVSSSKQLCLCFLPGILPKPTIWTEPGSVIPWGTPVTIWCQGSLKAQEYLLHKEGKLWPWERQPALEPKDKAKFSIMYMTAICQPSWTQDSQRTPSEVFQGLFPVGPVDPSLKWSFRCYGYYSNTLQVWSLSSDPLELLDSASDPKDYTVENLIRMGMATVMLVVLGILLFESWYSQRRTQDAASR